MLVRKERNGRPWGPTPKAACANPGRMRCMVVNGAAMTGTLAGGFASVHRGSGHGHTQHMQHRKSHHHPGTQEADKATLCMAYTSCLIMVMNAGSRHSPVVRTLRVTPPGSSCCC